ncbi:MAG: chorismate synthase [Chloroflexota bacterium]|jgi:chorismate synthase
MTLRRLRLLTAGESHGPALSGILEGLPADLRVSTAKVDKELARRQHGYGSGRRMRIERDRVQWTAGLRFGRTLGSPLAFAIANRDWANWEERMSVEPVAPSRRPRPITLARPGHADLAGAIKYDTDDMRNVLERASARSTAPRVAAGAVARQLLEACGVRIWSFVDQLGPVRAFGGADEPVALVPRRWVDQDRRAPTPLRCPDPAAEAAMMAEVDAAIEAGDSVGGSFVVVAEGMPVGLGSNAEWDTRIDSAIAAAMMGIQAVKGIEIGLGFGVVSRRGSQVHDEVEPGVPAWQRKTNRAGGTEGGMTNGAAVVARVGVKPVATLRKPLDSVDLLSGEVRRAHIERSDVAIIPRAAVVGEAMLALVLADALLADLGGDTMGDVRAAVRRRRRRSEGPRGRAGSGTLSTLPDDAAEEATVVGGTDA